MEALEPNLAESGYEVENPSVVATNLRNILFNPEIADVIILAGGEAGLPLERIPAHK